MSTNQQTWSGDSLDAVSIWAPGAQVVIEGIEGDQVLLDGAPAVGTSDQFNIAPVGRWLQVHLWDNHSGPAAITLRLPKNKDWAIDLYAYWGKVTVGGLRARMQLAVQKGDVRVADCQGIFTVTSGDGTVELINCTEAEMPERPEQPQPGPTPPPAKHVPWSTLPPNWLDWDYEDWTAWGTAIGDQVRSWAQQFNGFLDKMQWMPQRNGINAHVARGSLYLENIQASTCKVRISKGAARLEHGRITNLVLRSNHGDVVIRSLLPAGDWVIENRHGNVLLALPQDAQARLDIATRQGNIHSSVPLVRVARPGPESRRGSRMVGSLGASGSPFQISVDLVHGDARLDLAPASTYTGQPAAQPAPQPAGQPTPGPATEPTAPAPVVATQPAAPAWESQVEAPAESAPVAAPASPAGPEPETDARWLVLEALKDGTINADEAEQLLLSLEKIA